MFKEKAIYLHQPPHSKKDLIRLRPISSNKEIMPYFDLIMQIMIVISKTFVSDCMISICMSKRSLFFNTIWRLIPGKNCETILKFATDFETFKATTHKDDKRNYKC